MSQDESLLGLLLPLRYSWALERPNYHGDLSLPPAAILPPSSETWEEAGLTSREEPLLQGEEVLGRPEVLGPGWREPAGAGAEEVRRLVAGGGVS